MIADDVKCRLRRIANTDNITESAKKAISDLRSLGKFQGKFKTYFENTWYPELVR